jgi:hypothetical protein
MQFLTIISIFLGLCASTHALPTPDEGTVDVTTPKSGDISEKPETENTAGPFVYVTNNFVYPLYLWSIASGTGPRVTIYPFQTYSEKLYYDQNSGIALKISRQTDGLYNGGPVLIFAYTLNLQEDTVYYSWGDTNGQGIPGVTYGTVEGTTCPTAQWPDEGNVTKACKITDLNVSIGN